MSVVQTVSMQCCNVTWTGSYCNLLAILVDDSDGERMAPCGALPVGRIKSFYLS